MRIITAGLVAAAFVITQAHAQQKTGGGQPMDLDLTKAVLVVPADLNERGQTAVDMLLDELETRTGVRWPVANQWPGQPGPVVSLGPIAAASAFAGPNANALPVSPAAEGYVIRTSSSGSAPSVIVAGADDRGVLFGAGRLLREMHMNPGSVRIAAGLDINTAPKYPMRGHQLGYRPKVNTYDAWTLPMWEQYFRDLVVFGTNSVEFMPPRTDDAADSPHFPMPQIDMLEHLSKMADRYDLDVWMWYPAMDPDYTDPGTAESSIKEWGEVFARMSRIDHVFVPGGDPGHTPPAVLMEYLPKQVENLHKYHPNAKFWLSPQGFTTPWLDEFLNYLNENHPQWLNGVVFAPQNRISLPELRKRVPEQYPIRHYPDITHSVRCQYPVPDWDMAYAQTEHREVINPRPIDYANICRLWDEYTIGFVTYSEGSNDDFNKILWSCLGWDPDMPVNDITRQFARYFIGDRYEFEFSQGLFDLEQNWRGPLITNLGVESTLKRFQGMERAATPKDLLNWRFQQALYRAYYDAYDRRRLLYETDLEAQALDALRQAPLTGSMLAMQKAEQILNRAVLERVAPDLRDRVFGLAEALYQSIHMQLSVSRYKAIDVGRGANLDLIDRPLTDAPWLLERFAQIRQLQDERQRLSVIEAIVNWDNPGPGGYYDDLGNLTRQPHLVRNLEASADPEFRQTPLVAFENNLTWRASWNRHAEVRYEDVMKMQYTNLDPNADYKVRVIYAGELMRSSGNERVPIKVRMVADGTEVHPLIPKERPVKPKEFDVPRSATADGQLTLEWNQDAGSGGAGRGCQVAEVWLIKKTPDAPDPSGYNLLMDLLGQDTTN